jgi:hypothetical protein
MKEGDEKRTKYISTQNFPHYKNGAFGKFWENQPDAKRKKS